MGIINATELHKELEKAGIPIEGVSSDGRIDFCPKATDQQREQAAQILETHDPDKIAQQEAKTKAALEALRAENADPVDVTMAEGKDAVIQLLVKKVTWLEQEIRNLQARLG